MTTLTQGHGIQPDERLRCAERIKCVKIWCAEEEEDDHGKPEHCRRHSRTEDTPRCRQACILRLLTDMAARFKANQDTSSHEVGEHPIPDGWRTSLIVRLCEDELCRLKAIGLGNCNRKPDDVQEEIKHDDAGAKFEDVPICLWIEVVHTDSDEQKSFRNDPLHGPEFDRARVGWIREIEDTDLGKQEIGGSLTFGSNESGPCSGTPPGNNEAEQTTESAATCFSSPARWEISKS